MFEYHFHKRSRKHRKQNGYKNQRGFSLCMLIDKWIIVLFAGSSNDRSHWLNKCKIEQTRDWIWIHGKRCQGISERIPSNINSIEWTSRHASPADQSEYDGWSVFIFGTDVTWFDWCAHRYVLFFLLKSIYLNKHTRRLT